MFVRKGEEKKGEEGFQFFCAYINNSMATSAYEIEWKDSQKAEKKNLNLGINIAWLLPT